MAASLYSPVHASNSLSRDAFLWLYLLLTLRCHMKLKTINCYPVMTTSTWMSLCGPFIRTISIYSYECYESIHIWEPLGRRGKKMLQGPSSQSRISTNWLESWNSVLIFTPWSSACSGYSHCFFDPRVVNEHQARPSPMTGELDSAYSTIANQLCRWN